MKLLQFTYPQKPDEIRAGFINGDGVVDVNKIDGTLGPSLIEILKKGQMDRVLSLSRTSQPTVPLSSIRLEAPISGMDKVIGVGMNYSDYCAEQGADLPKEPFFFTKFTSTVIGPNDELVIRPDVTQAVDFEAELTVVIGKKVTNLRSEDAFDCILGYTAAQDITARDWQSKNNGQVALMKCMDTFSPVGPWIVTKDEIKDPHTLDVKCSVNGVLKQNSNTNLMVHKIPAIIERLTSVMTLLPGDIIMTGTPAGVGFSYNPPEYLKPGDTIETFIEDVGSFSTKVVRFQ